MAIETRTIKRAYVTPRFVDFNFEEDFWVEEKGSCSTIIFWNIAKGDGVEQDIYNHGLVGMKTQWEKVGLNYEFRGFKV